MTLQDSWLHSVVPCARAGPLAALVAILTNLFVAFEGWLLWAPPGLPWVDSGFGDDTLLFQLLAKHL